ncbi:MAG TPA: nickel-responsive transcriptional regulator NikR [Planctomycetota bacterium]|nr:nickel-responsive transcriptional regulator NikR [Planctomycetota bacterium]
MPRSRPSPRLVRTSFSLERPLHEAFERLARQGRYANRSEFLRDLIRDKLVAREWATDGVCLGTITILYDHNRRALSDKLVKLQHAHFRSILAATHVHLDHDLCAEVILVRARARSIRTLAALLGREKGVLHASLSLGSIGRGLPHP